MSANGFNVTLCAHPADTREAQDAGFPLCHLAYRIGADGGLYRSGLGVNVRGGLLGISDRDITDETPFRPELAREIRRECDVRGFGGVLCDFERAPNAFTTRFSYEAAIYFSSLRMRFYLPEKFADAAPGAQLLIDAAVSNGSFDAALRSAAFRYGAGRVALLFEPICMDFAMPAPNVETDSIPAEKLEEIRRRENAVAYFSHELCANYFTYRTSSGESRFAVFDDTRSMLRKLDTARRAGFHEAFVCYPDACGELEHIRDLCV